MAVMPTAQISHRWLYPPFFSTAATSGAILTKQRHVSFRHIIARSLSFFQKNVKSKGVNGKGAYGNVFGSCILFVLLKTCKYNTITDTYTTIQRFGFGKIVFMFSKTV